MESSCSSDTLLFKTSLPLEKSLAPSHSSFWNNLFYSIFKEKLLSYLTSLENPYKGLTFVVFFKSLCVSLCLFHSDWKEKNNTLAYILGKIGMEVY